MNLPDHLKPPSGGYKKLKATPAFPGTIPTPSPDELDEFKILWEYEQAIEEAKQPQY